MSEYRKMGWLWLTSIIVGITEAWVASFFDLPEWGKFMAFNFIPLFIAFPVCLMADYFQKEIK